MRPIPAIDLKDGRTVRLFKGRFDQVSEYDFAPEDLAGRYLSLGVDWVHVVDLDGARSGNAGNRETIGRMAALSRGRIQVGGGVRTEADLQALLELGAGRVVVGSTAVEQPEEVMGWLGRYGPERVVVAFDVRLDAAGTPIVLTRGWTKEAGLSLWEALEAFYQAGLEHLLCTDADRDGAMEGPNVELYAECTARFPAVQVQASGGVRHLADLEALRLSGADSAIIGKALLDGRITDEEIRSFLRDA
jgi:phosphoribosylformimino-5-aminoimidazole carboxamide ribotide isomerase